MKMNAAPEMRSGDSQSASPHTPPPSNVSRAPSRPFPSVCFKALLFALLSVVVVASAVLRIQTARERRNCFKSWSWWCFLLLLLLLLLVRISRRLLYTAASSVPPLRGGSLYVGCGRNIRISLSRPSPKHCVVKAGFDRTLPYKRRQRISCRQPPPKAAT